MALGTTKDATDKEMNLVREAIPHQKRSFFNIVQRGGGQTHVKKLWCKFCIILKAFRQHKIDIKSLLRVEMSQIERKIVNILG